MILRIDQIANRKGMARQSQIKPWLAEKLKAEQNLTSEGCGDPQISANSRLQSSHRENRFTPCQSQTSRTL